MAARRYQVYLSCAVQRTSQIFFNTGREILQATLFYEIFTIHNDVLAIFRTFTTEDFHSLVEGQTNISLHSRTIAKKSLGTSLMCCVFVKCSKIRSLLAEHMP